jgi:hypothetical protein
MKRLIGIVLALLLVAPVSAQSPQVRHLLLRQMPAATGGGGAVFTFKGQDGTNSAGTFTSTTVDLGTASADRRVIIATTAPNGGLSGCTVNGVTLLQDVQANPAGNPQTVIYSGVVNTGSGAATIVITSAAGLVQFLAWTGTGGSSALVKHTSTSGTGAPSSISIAVDAGDFLIVADPFSGFTYAGSTETPTATRTETNTTGHVGAGEWNTIISTNAAFSINAGSADFMAAASYK